MTNKKFIKYSFTKNFIIKNNNKLSLNFITQKIKPQFKLKKNIDFYNKILFKRNKNNFFNYNFSTFLTNLKKRSYYPFYLLLKRANYNNIITIRPRGVIDYSTFFKLVSSKNNRKYISVSNKFILSLINRYLNFNSNKFLYILTYTAWAKKLQLIPFSFYAVNSIKIVYLINSLYKETRRSFFHYLYFFSNYKKFNKYFLLLKIKKKKLKEFPINYFKPKVLLNYIYFKRFIYSNFKKKLYLKIYKYKRFFNNSVLLNYKNFKINISIFLNKIYYLKSTIKKLKNYYTKVHTKFNYNKILLPTSIDLFTYQNSNKTSIYFPYINNNNKFLLKKFNGIRVVSEEKITKSKKFKYIKTNNSLIITNSRSNFFISLVDTKTGHLNKSSTSGKFSFQTSQEKRSLLAFQTTLVSICLYLKSIKVANLDYIKIIINFNINKVKFNKFYIFNLLSILKNYKIKFLRLLVVLKRPHSLGTRKPKLKRK